MAGLQVVPRVDTVNDVMTGWVVTISASDSLLKARDLMAHSLVSQLVVADHRNRPLGLISKRDIARFLLEDTTTRDLKQILVSEAASKSIPTLRPDLPVLNAARLFDTENLACAIVTDDQPLAGVMTETDLCSYYSRKLAGKFIVSDFMSRDFIFAKSSYPVVHVAHAIIFRQPSVPVIDEELVGILTLSDLLSIRERRPRASRAGLLFSSKPDSSMALMTTKDLMTRDPITSSEDTDLAQAARIIVGKGIASLPVIDSKSRVVGLLTKHDIVTALGRVGGSKILET